MCTGASFPCCLLEASEARSRDQEVQRQIKHILVKPDVHREKTREKAVGNGLVKEGQGPERAGFVLRAGPLGERALRAGPQNGSSLEGRAAGEKGEGLGGGAVRRA